MLTSGSNYINHERNNFQFSIFNFQFSINMISVAQAVEGIVKHKPYLSESLAAGIINISALARQIQKEVEKLLGKPVNAGAIVMALNRLAPYLQVREQVQLNKLLNNMGDIILSTAAQQYGGFTVPEVDKILGPYAQKSYDKYINEFLKGETL